MSRIAGVFSSAGRPLFIAFIVAGDPDFESSIAAARALIEGGADILEIGIPFSDPVADGPAIQRADSRALQAGMTPDRVFDMVRRIRGFSDIPLVLLSYYNTLYHRGLSRFYQDASDAGVDGVLVADMPVEESGPILPVAGKNGIDQVFMACETTSSERLDLILEKATGFLYLVSHMGVTGVLPDLPPGVPGLVERIREKTTMPLAVGFGIATPDHACKAIDAGADAAIAGSAIVAIIEEYRNEPEQMVSMLKHYSSSMSNAMKTRAYPGVPEQ